jgi:hypothetical protein
MILCMRAKERSCVECTVKSVHSRTRSISIADDIESEVVVRLCC